jgi:hypothetical protein
MSPDTTPGDYGDDLNVELSDAEDRAAADLKFSNDVELANQSNEWLKSIGSDGDYGSDTGVGSAGTSYTFDPSVLGNLSFSKVNDYLKGNRGLVSLLGGAGVAALGLGNPTTKSSIYKGGIPNLVATRNMITSPPVGRRAGAGGVNYGGDVTYSLAPEGQKPYSLTRGDSAFITDPQGQANVLKGTGGDDPQSMANKISYNLPGGWANYTPDQKITWFNQNNVSIDQLRAAGVPQSDIDYMWSNGYTSGRPADWGKKPETTPAVVPPVVQAPKSEGLTSALGQGLTEDKYISNIKDWLTQNADASDTAVRAQMDSFGISPADVAKALGQDVNKIQDKYNKAFSEGTAQQKADAYNMLLGEGLTDAQIRAAIDKSTGKQTDEDWSYLQNLAKPKDVPPQAPTKSAGLMSALEQGMTEEKYINNIKDFLTANADASDAEVYEQMKQYGIGASDVARALGVDNKVITDKLEALGVTNYAMGGMAKGRYLQGGTDGMADEIPAQIGRDQPAALSHGEFVIPADVVSHMGNGNSDAGAKKLYEMMDRIRMARTGNKEQGKKINPDKFMPGGLAKAYANGGSVKGFATGGTTTLPVNVTGQQAGLSNWAGEYATDLMGQGRALANMPFQQYMGPLTAGPSALQNKVTQGLESLDFPGTLGKSFTSAGAPTIGEGGQPVGGGGIASSYMNPYLKNVLDPQLEELRRQSQINLQPGLAKLTSAGGFGGGRQAIMESEAGRNLLNAQNTAIGTGYANAYDKAMQQFNTEQGQAKTLADMMAGQGATNRAIEAEGVAADKAQFEEARANPFKMVQFQQSLLSGMPINASDYTIQDPSSLTKVAQGVNTVDELLRVLYGIEPAKKK